MAYLPNCSDIFKTVMSEIDCKYVNYNSLTDKTGNCVGSSMTAFPLNGNCSGVEERCLHRIEYKKGGSYRVQWIDECEMLPLVYDNRQSKMKSKGKPTSILKRRPN